MKTRVSLLVVIALVQLANAQPPDSLWSSAFGGSDADICDAILLTDDGGFIVAGTALSFGAGDWDVWAVKTDGNGDSVWSRTFGGIWTEHCSNVLQINDGYVLGGYTSSYGVGTPNYGNMWLLKTDVNGDSVWSRTFGGKYEDVCQSIHQTNDGGFILAGRTHSFGVATPEDFDYWLVKTDANGDSMWSRTFGGDCGDECYSVRQTDDGGYILAGITCSFRLCNWNIWLLKTDADGDSMWSRIYSGLTGAICNSVRQTPDGGFIIAGTKDYHDFWLIKTDSNGDSLSTRTFGGRNPDWCLSAELDSDGGYILGGATFSYGTGTPEERNMWVVKTDAGGDSMWSCVFGGYRSDGCNSIKPTQDGGYVCAGWTSSYSPWSPIIDMWVVRVGQVTGAEELPYAEIPSTLELHSYPNPFNATSTITYSLPSAGAVELKLFDVSGRQVSTLQDGMQNAGEHRVSFDAGDLPSGLYLARLTAGEQIKTAKILLIK